MGNFLIRKSINGQYYFILKTENNEVIARSEMYKTKASCEGAIHAVKNHASNADIQDISSNDEEDN